MFAFFVATFALAQLGGTFGNAIDNEVVCDKELMLAFVVNRHGERTPDADELSLSDIKDKLRNLTYIEGLEGLTNVGKRRAYQLGKFIRQRYGAQGYGLISNLYLKDQISIRSTDKERTKMTVQIAMAAVYPPEVEQQWDEAIGKVWQPVPYTAYPLTEDYLRYYANCKRFKTLMAKAKEDSMQDEFAPYRELTVFLTAKTGQNFTENPLLHETLLDLFRSQVGMDLGLPEWAHPILARLNEAATLAYKLYFRTDEMKKIGGGVLLHDFIKAASDIAAGKSVSKRLHLFSAHDFNIGALMDVTKVKDSPLPEYGALFALELYKSRDGEFSVVPIYLPQAGESGPMIKEFHGCEGTCGLSKFITLTKKFDLPESEFYQICGIKTEL